MDVKKVSYIISLFRGQKAGFRSAKNQDFDLYPIYKERQVGISREIPLGQGIIA